MLQISNIIYTKKGWETNLQETEVTGWKEVQLKYYEHVSRMSQVYGNRRGQIIVIFTIFGSLCCLAYSQMKIAPVTWTFSDLTTPCCGISMHMSSSGNKFTGTPSFSFLFSMKYRNYLPKTFLLAYRFGNSYKIRC